MLYMSTVGLILTFEFVPTDIGRMIDEESDILENQSTPLMDVINPRYYGDLDDISNFI